MEENKTVRRAQYDAELKLSKKFSKIVEKAEKAFGKEAIAEVLNETEDDLKTGIGVSQRRIDDAKIDVETTTEYARAKAIIADFKRALNETISGDLAVLRLRRILLQRMNGKDIESIN